MRLLVVMHEGTKKAKTVTYPSHALIAHYQSSGWGVFRTVNSFDPEVGRKISGLIALNAWYCEIDKQEKQNTMRKLFEAPIPPSLIVESKNGYHLYWTNMHPEKCSEEDQEEYRNICKGLSQYFNGDRLWDVARLLREPGWDHLKDPEDPFKVRVIMETEAKWSQKEMKKAFPNRESAQDKKADDYERNFLRSSGGEGSWIEQLIQYPVQEGLERLSGSKYVNGDEYSFLDHNDGTYQIEVNGAPTSSWIDANGKIGSHKRWGPSLYKWLLWYLRDRSLVREAAKEVLGITSPPLDHKESEKEK